VLNCSSGLKEDESQSTLPSSRTIQFPLSSVKSNNTSHVIYNDIKNQINTNTIKSKTYIDETIGCMSNKDKAQSLNLNISLSSLPSDIFPVHHPISHTTVNISVPPPTLIDDVYSVEPTTNHPIPPTTNLIITNKYDDTNNKIISNVSKNQNSGGQYDIYICGDTNESGNTVEHQVEKKEKEKEKEKEDVNEEKKEKYEIKNISNTYETKIENNNSFEIGSVSEPDNNKIEKEDKSDDVKNENNISSVQIPPPSPLPPISSSSSPFVKKDFEEKKRETEREGDRRRKRKRKV